MSLPRRDGQGHRRLCLVAVVLVATIAAGCHGGAREPVDHAEIAPPTHGTVPSPSGPQSVRTDPEPFIAGSFDDAVVGEASGVAASVRNPGWVYVLDDGPGARGVIAVDTVRGGQVEVVVRGLTGRDTEGLAVGACGPAAPRPAAACLFVGDIGNNLDAWPSVDVWRVREPVLRARRRPLVVRGARRTYTFAGAPADAEALLVAGGRPLLVTKERRDERTGTTPAPQLLAPDGWRGRVLRNLGRIDLPAPTVGLAAAAVGNVVTGGEVGDGLVVLRTYDHVVVYTPPRPGAPVSGLPDWEARELPGTPRLPQPEGLGVDGCGLWLVSERVDSLWLVPWRAIAADAGADDIEERRCPSGDGGS